LSIPQIHPSATATQKPKLDLQDLKYGFGEVYLFGVWGSGGRTIHESPEIGQVERFSSGLFGVSASTGFSAACQGIPPGGACLKLVQLFERIQAAGALANHRRPDCPPLHQTIYTQYLRLPDTAQRKAVSARDLRFPPSVRKRRASVDGTATSVRTTRTSVDATGTSLCATLTGTDGVSACTRTTRACTRGMSACTRTTRTCIRGMGTCTLTTCTCIRGMGACTCTTPTCIGGTSACVTESYGGTGIICGQMPAPLVNALISAL
jgi:hypothetical protein